MPIELGKKIGPLTTRTWLIIGVGTVGVIWYVRKKQSALASTASGEPVATPSSTVGDSVDWTSPASMVGASPSFDSSGVDFAGLQQGQEEQTQVLGDILATLQAPSMEPTPVTVVGANPKRIKKQIAGVNEQIDKLRRGGITHIERPKVKKLRARRQTLRGKL